MKMGDTLLWVMYDIQNDKVRNKVAQYCKQAGLYRVQKSVFLGTLNWNDMDTLNLQIEAIIDREHDSVYLFPMCKSDFSKVVLLGQAFHKDLVSDQLKTLFL